MEGETIQETLHRKVALGFPLKPALIPVLGGGMYSCLGAGCIAERLVWTPLVERVKGTNHI